MTHQSFDTCVHTKILAILPKYKTETYLYAKMAVVKNGTPRGLVVRFFFSF